MFRLRLIKGLSYSNGKIKATQKEPEVSIENEEEAEKVIETGFFELISKDVQIEEETEEETADVQAEEETEDVQAEEETSINFGEMTLVQLKSYAAQHSIDITGLSKKAELLMVITSAN